MGEPEALHPFSSHFRSQLADVLSRPAMVSQIKQITDDKVFLETEIDSYSGVEFENSSATNCTKRPPTPPKPVNRTFTFEKSNPFCYNSSESNTLSLPKYAEVNKPKDRPKVPPKPKIRSNDTTGTLPLTRKLPHEQSKISEEDYFFRVNSLPNLTPDIHQNNRASGNFLLPESQNPSTPGYGQLSRLKHTDESSTSVYHMAHNDADYCDVIPESPPCTTDNTTTVINDNCYENVYEDVNSKPTAVEELNLHSSPEKHEGSDSDYTLMCSPVSEINFTFSRKSLYENSAMIHSPNSDVFHQDEYENVGSPKLPLADPNRVGLPEQVQQSQILAISKDHVSPTSSVDGHDSSVYSVQSSMASTTASSFQRVQVCFFPPSPPPDFYQNGVEVDRPGSVTSGSSSRSRPSRSRIPVPIKPKKDPSKTSMCDASNNSQPPTPTPSPVVRLKSSSKSAKQIELSPPLPPGDDMIIPTNSRRLGSSGKGARWYEKLGCIQTETVQPSEPYGRPGERKRSKSLNREQTRKSQFFLPVEPNASDPPITNHS